MATETPGGPAGAPDPGAGPQSPAGAEAPPAYGGGQVVQQQQATVGPRANFGQRLLALIIDVILAIVAYVILAAIFDSLGALIATVGWYAYMAYFEGTPSGQTVGKRVLNIRVIDFNTGGPIGFGRGVIRNISRILSGIPIYLGYFWMIWDSQNQTWHDKLATTIVVPTNAYPVDSWPG